MDIFLILFFFLKKEFSSNHALQVKIKNKKLILKYDKTGNILT